MTINRTKSAVKTNTTVYDNNKSMLMRQADDDLSSITGSHYYCEADDGIRTMSEQPPPLQGRSREKLELLKAYSRVVQTHKSQVVFVHGMSGQGKTSIVDTLREPVCDANGYFCCGKFFSNSGIQEPHSAITAAFSDLCDFVLQSHDFEQSRARIKGALTAHNDGHLLSRSINLAPFLNESPETPVETTTFSRFRGACKSFLLAMASQQHPVVLFLDDIQWMDNGSQRLIDMFINDLDLKHVMFVLAYRDEEVNSALQEIIQTTRKAGVTDIQLTNLDLSSVRSMLAWHLGLPATSDMDELSELTLRRTGGNPFDVSLFLEAIGTKKYLLSNKRFDLDKIRSCSQLSETAAELMYQKVHRVPAEMQTILTVASMLGYTFEEQGVILDVVKRIPTCDGQASHHPAKAMQSLLHAVELGFIETVKEGYQFTHDKLQTAFLNLVSETTREHYHLLIGQAYLAHDKFIYKAAVHLNAAPEFLVNKDRHIQLARINLGGSRCCQKISAFDKAGSLLHQGIDLLNLAGVMWAHEVLDLSLELTESLARMALVVGDFATCSAAIKDAMRHVDTREAKVKLMIINVECRMANNEMEESVKASTDTLAELGVNLPRKVTMRHVICKVVKLKFLMSGMTNEDILRLPTVQDESITSSIRLLIYIHLYCMLMNQEELAVYAALHAMDLTMKHGLSTYASSALSVFGIAVLSMGNHERAYNLGTLALQLMGQTPSREADCPTIGNVNTLLRHWKEPIADLCGPLYEAASIGFGKGELIYSTYCYSQAQGMEGVAGVPLGVLEESLKIQYRRIHALGQEELLVWIRPQMQYVANFRSSSTDWRQLALMSGEFMNFDKHLREANASSNNIVKVTALMIRAKLENLFGFHRMARETFEELEMIGDVTHMTYAGTIWSWGAGVANYESYRTDRKRKYLRKARKYKKLLKQRNAFGPNASTFLAHLNMKETYLRRIRTKQIDTSYDDETLQLLDHSLERFMVDGNPCKPYFVSASAFVDAGFIAERMGRLAQAERYFERAKIIYHGSWGAFAPAAWLNEKCMVLRNKDESTNSYESVSDRWVGGIVNVYEKCEFA